MNRLKGYDDPPKLFAENSSGDRWNSVGFLRATPLWSSAYADGVARHANLHKMKLLTKLVVIRC